MKKYLVTNAAFTGEVTLVYDANDMLVCIDLLNATMQPETIAAFKRAVPVVGSAENFKAAFSAATTIVAANVEISWEMMYKDWPYKRNAFEGKKVWDKMSASDKVAAFYNKKDYISYCKRQQSKYEYQPMMIDRFLRKREFETDWKKLK